MPISVLSAREPDGWTEYDDSGVDSPLIDALEVVLLSERLVVLAGLGTSLCIKDEAGERLAPTMQDLWNRVQAADQEGFAYAVETVGPGEEEHPNIELLLSRCQAALQLHDDEDLQSFVNGAEQVIAEACSFLGGSEQVGIHASFLRKLARRSASADRLRLFTTNYDLVFERAAASAGLASLDGFSPAHPGMFDASNFDLDIVRRRAADGSDMEYVAGVHYLYKLHGSIDWFRKDGTVQKLPSTGSEEAERCLIFPRESKFQLSYEPPFFDLLASFQSALRQPNVGLLVAGFGFADPHVARPVLSAIQRNPSLSAVFIDPCLNEKPPPPLGPVERLVREGDRRITLVASTFEDLVPLIPDLQPETHSEMHLRRSGQAGLT